MPSTLFTLTDRGLSRDKNQDAALVRDEGDCAVLVIADGMGGKPAGELASALVMRAFEVPSGAEDPARYLEGRSLAAHAAIEADAAGHPERAGMGSTVVAALIEGDRLWVTHVGDSRAYLWDEDGPPERLRRLTRDHTVAELAIDAGTLTPMDALTDRRRHLLTRALGGASHTPEVAGPFAVPPRGVVLLTSDGVHGVLPDEVLEALVERHRGRALLEAIRDAVHEAGAPDNLAVALLEGRE